MYFWRRLKNENETRKHEIHGLKDILVRENDNRIRETEELRAAMELSTQELVDGIEKAKSESKKQVKTLEKDLEETMIKDKKIMSEKLENSCNDLKKKIEMETNEIRYTYPNFFFCICSGNSIFFFVPHRDKMQNERKGLATKMDEENDERRKELGLMRNQLQKEREEMREQLESDTGMVLKQLEKDSNEIMGLIKKERTDREREGNTLKERIDNERKEMQILIDKDRDDTNRKLKEEHDQRRIEQMELVQRLDNNEKCGKNDITVRSKE